MPDGGDQRDAAGRDRSQHALIVEGHQVFQAAAAPGDDQDVGPGHRTARRDGVEAGDGGGYLFGGAVALHRHGPQQDRPGKTPSNGGADVLDDGAALAADHADDAGEHGQRLLAGRVEEALGGEAHPQHFYPRQQRAGAGVFHALDNKLVG